MFNISNHSHQISPMDAFIKTDHVKRTLLRSEGILWTDLMVLCTLKRLEEQRNMITPSEIIANLGMSTCWVYRSMRKLHTKKLVHIHTRPTGSAFICISNWGNILLSRAEDAFLSIG